jgi:hypothetical protein
MQPAKALYICTPIQSIPFIVRPAHAAPQLNQKQARTMLALLVLVLGSSLSPGIGPPSTKLRSSVRWLSFYNDCAWGNNRNDPHDATAGPKQLTPHAEPAPIPLAAPPAQPATGFVGLPLLEGHCATVTPTYDRGQCWLDKLEVTKAANTSAMLLLETSGPVFCGKMGCKGCKYVCPDDCDDPSLKPYPPSFVNWVSLTQSKSKYYKDPF